MTHAIALLSSIAFFAITTNPGYGDWYDKFKKDNGYVIKTIGDTIRDTTDGKDKIDELGKVAQAQEEKFSSQSDDKPRFDSAWIKEIQQRLTALGLNPGPVDGAFGKKTADAISNFQKIGGLTADGKPRPSVMQALRAKTRDVQTAQQRGQPAAQGTKDPYKQTIEKYTKRATTTLSSATGYLAPAGVPIGMSAEQARAVLTAAGYKEVAPCRFIQDQQKGRILFIARAGWTGQSCQGAVNYFMYREEGMPVLDPPSNIIAQIADQFGAKAECNPSYPSSCMWKAVPNAPLVESGSVNIEKKSLTLSLRAVKNLEEAVNLQTQPAGGDVRAASTDDQATGGGMSPLKALRAGVKGNPPIASAMQSSTSEQQSQDEQDQGRTAALQLEPVPLGVLIYKFAPTLFSEKDLVRANRRQVEADERAYRSAGVYRDHVFMYAKEQVADRHSQFAAEDLLPIFKAKLSQLAQQLPARVQFTTAVRVSDLRFKDGLLSIRSGHAQGGEGILYNHYRLPDQQKLRHPPMGSRELINLPNLRADLGGMEIPESVNKLSMSKAYLAVDRILNIGAVAMKRTDAERLMKRPKCATTISMGETLAGGEKKKKAEKKAAQCRAEIKRFNEGVLIVYDVEIVGLESSARGLFFKANVLNASVFGTRNELLKSYDSDDFEVGLDTWQDKIQPEHARQPQERGLDQRAQRRKALALAKRKAAEEAAIRKKAEKKTSKRIQTQGTLARGKQNEPPDSSRARAGKDGETAAQSGLASVKADILGVRLGMTIDEADRIIREKIDVGWVLELSEDAKNEWIYKPYQSLRIYMSKDGTEQFTLFIEPAHSNKILGLGRTVALASEIPKEMVLEKVKAKYGNNYIEARHSSQLLNHLIWSDDVDAFSGNCASHIESSDYRDDLQTTDGQLVKDMIPQKMSIDARNGWVQIVGIYVDGGLLYKGKSSKWEAEKWLECGPTIMAGIEPMVAGKRRNELRVTIHDLSRYADYYLKNAQKTEQTIELPDL